MGSVEAPQDKSICEEPLAVAVKLDGAVGGTVEGVIVIVAEPDLVGSAIEVAFRETVGGVGGVAGAL